MPSNPVLTGARKPVAIIIASTRSPRIGPSIAQRVQRALEAAATAAGGSRPRLTFELLDLRAQGLPLFDEPTVPAWHPADDPTPHYARPHARAWSATVRRFGGFVFVTPQYNWSVPAGLKNALDYLCHEWGAKPAGIVSYGGRGGGRAAAHLRDILTGLHMRLLETGVEVTVPVGALKDVAGGEGVDEEATGAAWEAADGERKVREMVGEMVRALEEVEGGE